MDLGRCKNAARRDYTSTWWPVAKLEANAILDPHLGAGWIRYSLPMGFATRGRPQKWWKLMHRP